MADEVTLNLPRDSTLAEKNELDRKRNDLLAAIAVGNAGPEFIDSVFARLLDDTNTTEIFYAWLPLAMTASGATLYSALCRFGVMLRVNRSLTVRFADESVSGDPSGVGLDWLADKKAAPLATDTVDPADDWTIETRETWYVRANAVSNADGTMDVKAIEGYGDGFDVTGETYPVYVFAPALYIKEWSDGQYYYKSWRSTPAGGYADREENLFPDGSRRSVVWHPAFPGGLNSSGALTSGAGRKCYNFASASAGIVAARKMSANEGLWTDCDTIYVLDQWQLRHWNLENSRIMEGCTSYSVQNVVAKAESGVKRVLVTKAQGASFIVGSTVSIGDKGSNSSSDRGNAYMRNIADLVQISSIETVAIDGTEYAAINLAIDAAIDVPATAWISSMPWHSGATESVKGHHDGSPVSNTAGKYPCRCAGIEMMNGAYTLGLDPLYNVTKTEDGDGRIYTAYSCRTSSKQASSITSDYKESGIVATFATNNAWQYVRKFIKALRGVLLPEKVGGSETTFFKSAFCGAGGAGVYSPWRFASLSYYGVAGFAAELGYYGPGEASWYGSPRLAGCGKIRGEADA